MFLPIHNFFLSLGIPGALALIAVEYLGVPLPSELSYFYMRSLIAKGRLSWVVAIVLIMAAHFIGSQIAYEIGRRIGGSGKQLSQTQELIHSWYKKRGGLLVFGAQLIGHIRPWTSYVAGFAGMPRKEFALYSMGGAFTLTIIILAFANVIGVLWKEYLLVRIGIAIVAGVILTITLFKAVRRLIK